MIHAAALYFRRHDGKDGVANRDDILAAILERERRLWNQTIRARKDLPEAICDAPIEQAAAYLTLVSLNEGVANRDRTITLLGNCSRLSGLDSPTIGQIADIFHELYPGPDWVNGVTPDLIGTYLLSQSDVELMLDT